MPIASHKPAENADIPKDNIPKIEPSGYKSIVINDDDIPLLSLLAYITGSPWTVNYYSQVISKHNDLREVDTGQPNVYQQYQLVNNLEIRVLSQLASSYDEDTGITSTTGTANFYPFVIPNVNDYFTAEADLNKKALFRINKVYRKSFNKQSVYEIDYTLVGYTDSTAEYNELNDKVIHKYYFNKERLIEGLQPILKEEDQNQVIDLNYLYSDILNYYLSTFYNQRYMTLVLPGQDKAIYDSFLVNYLLSILETTDSNIVKDIRQIPTDNEFYLKQDQLFSLMSRKDFKSISRCNQVMGLVSKTAFKYNGNIQGFIYSTMTYMMYPDLPDTSLMISEKPTIKDVIADALLTDTTNSKGLDVDVEIDVLTIDEVDHPYIYHAHKDNKYIFSDNFYLDTVNKSILEMLTISYLKNETIDKTMLISLANKYKDWNRMDQFYYGPIILTLIKEVNRMIYT